MPPYAVPENWDPENLVDVQVAVMALRGVGVGAEKKSVLRRYCPDNRVTGQVNVNQTGKGDDVFAEHIRLRFTGRQKNLVMTGFQGAQQRPRGKNKTLHQSGGISGYRGCGAQARRDTSATDSRKTAQRKSAPAFRWTRH